VLDVEVDETVVEVLVVVVGIVVSVTEVVVVTGTSSPCCEAQPAKRIINSKRIPKEG